MLLVASSVSSPQPVVSVSVLAGQLPRSHAVCNTMKRAGSLRDVTGRRDRGGGLPTGSNCKFLNPS